MKFTIYQVTKENTRNFGFMDLDQRKSVLKTTEIKMDLYDRVWEGEIEASSEMAALNQLFTKFNIDHPAEYKGRSMSVSDLVLFPETGVWYYCDSFGWEKVKPTFKQEQCQIGYNVTYREEDGELYSGYIHNTAFDKRPNTIEVVIDTKGGEVLADLVPLDSIIELTKPEGAEFAYLDEANGVTE